MTLEVLFTERFRETASEFDWVTVFTDKSLRAVQTKWPALSHDANRFCVDVVAASFPKHNSDGQIWAQMADGTVLLIHTHVVQAAFVDGRDAYIRPIRAGRTRQ